MSFLNLMTLRLIPCFFMDLYNVFIFKSEWTYVTDCVDFSSVLHGLQMAEYSINCNWKSREQVMKKIIMVLVYLYLRVKIPMIFKG